MKRLILFSGASLFAALSVQGQVAFQDLDFEAATLAPTSGFGGNVPIASALPGWSGSIGNVQVTQVQQNNFDAGTAVIDIFGPNFAAVGQGFGFGEGVIDGNYTVFLQSGANPQGGSVGVNVSIWQTGTIPANAQSLEFKAWSFEGIGVLSVSFEGNSLSPVLLSSQPNQSGIPVNEYGVNIAPYAGQTGQLEFTSVFTSQGASWNELDDITFSPNAVPEPSTLALIVMGGAALAARRCRKNRNLDHEKGKKGSPIVLGKS